MARSQIAVLTVGPVDDPLAELILVDGQPVASRDAKGKLHLFAGDVAHVVVDGPRAEALGAFQWWQQVYETLVPEEVRRLGIPLAVLDPLEVLQALVGWAAAMGGWDNPVWERARLLLGIWRGCGAWPREPRYDIRSDQGFWDEAHRRWVGRIADATLYPERRREGRQLPAGQGVTWVRQGAGQEPYVSLVGVTGTAGDGDGGA